MNNAILKWLFRRLNGKILRAPDTGREVWVLKKPSGASLLARSKTIAASLSGRRHLAKAFYLAKEIVFSRLNSASRAGTAVAARRMPHRSALKFGAKHSLRSL
jgi:hypothetical protein